MAAVTATVVTTVQPTTSDDTPVLPTNVDGTRSLSLVAINSIQSMEKYHVKRLDKKTYRSGAWYIGKFNGTQRIGWGQFNWSDGGYFDGNHVDNKRQGEGRYTWSDGSSYVGNFHNDLRHGFGELTFSSGETYTGQFFNDMKHGVGTYVWNGGASYAGSFRDNKKCGFGVLSLPNGDTFEGIYKNDQRCGAGIYTHKQDGSQDVGLWKGNTLERLCTVAEGAFLYEHMSEHYINAGSNISTKLKLVNRTISSKPNTPSQEKKGNVPECEFTVPAQFPYKSINEGIRDVAVVKGRLEIISEEFINAASVGDLTTVKQTVESGLINVNVSDKTGYFALLAASVNCHIKIINYLLDNGANINQITDEGLSCLSACHILLYAEQNYIDNIAEIMGKDNLFNTVEFEKKTGTVINRNERKMILAIYEEIFKPYVDKNARNELSDATAPSRRRTSRGESSCEESARGSIDYSAYNDDDKTCGYDPWKLDFYQRSMDRVKEIDEINRTFKDIMLNPHKLSNKNRNVENIDLCSLDCRTENWSRNADSYTANIPSETNNVLPTTVVSIMGYADEYRTKSKRSNEKIKKLMNSERRPHLLNTIELLLSRGADPSVSTLPMPVLFFAVKSGEPTAVNELLRCNADTSARLNHLQLCPLHIAAALPCNEGVLITELLLKHGADPNARDGFRENDVTLGRTPLHIACSREDDYRQAKSVVSLLLSYGADPDLLCFGNAPLSLAIASGNDLVVDTLLRYNANVSLKLTHGLGSILCVAVSFQAERRRTPTKRMELVEKLIKSGADMLTPVNIANKLPPATVMDYAYNVYYQDRRISCTPYHALSSLERECYNARRDMLERLAGYFRAAVSVKEKELEDVLGAITSHEQLMATVKKPKTRKEMRQGNLERDENCGLGYVTVKRAKLTQGGRRLSNTGFSLKRRYRYCNECGRSVAVRLAPCPRCKEVFYCSKNCKIKLWNSRHRDECAKTTGVTSPNIDIADVSADNTKMIINTVPGKKDSKKSIRHNSRNQLGSKSKGRRKDDSFLPQI